MALLAGFLFVQVSWTVEFVERARLAGPDATGDDRFGTEMAVSGETLAVTAPEHGSARMGAVYVYVRTEEGWNLQAKIDPPKARPFARAVALDGETLLVGGLEDRAATGGIDAGLAFIFKRQGGSWAQSAELIPADAQSVHRTGNAVAIRGDTAVVAARDDEEAGQYAGAVYIFQRVGGGWNQVQKLTASQPEPNAQFGNSIAFDGERLAVAAMLENGLRGAAYVFKREGNTWMHQQRIVAPDPAGGAIFGRSIALEGRTLVVGRTDDHEAGPSAGAAFIFTEQADGWRFLQKLAGSDTKGFDQFGTALALSGGRILVGAPSASFNDMPTAGAAYLFERKGLGWAEAQRLSANDPATFSGFGWEVTLDNNFAGIGSIFHESGKGVAYLFEDKTDTEPPVILAAVPSITNLFPPNRKMVPVTVRITARDNSGKVTTRIASVATNEPRDRGPKSPDIQILDDQTVNLRAERNHQAKARTYTIRVEATDPSGNMATALVPVLVTGR